MKYHYSYRRFTYPIKGERSPLALREASILTRGSSDSSDKQASACDPSFGDISQVGSLAGAAHLLHINAGVLRQAQIEQKSIVEHKGKSLLDSRSSVPIHGVKAWPNDPLVSLLFKGRSRR